MTTPAGSLPGPGAATPRGSALAPRPDPRRFGLILFAGLSLLAGLFGALILLGVVGPSAAARLAGSHGLLMSFGFLGTLIALERAVALGQAWGYAAPLASGLAGIALIVVRSRMKDTP